MNADDIVYRDAVDFIDGAKSSFSDLLDHLMEKSALGEAVADTGFEPADILIDILEESGEFRVSERHDVVVRVNDLLDGLTLTHRLTSEEHKEGIVEASPDLVSLFDLGDLTLEDGRALRLRYDWADGDRYHVNGSVEGPIGWLDDYSPGDLLVLTRGSDGVRVSRTEDPGDGSAESAALLAEFEAETVDRPGVGFDATLLVDGAIIGDPALFRSPVLPIGELFDATGLELAGTWVGRQGEDWEPAHVIAAVAMAVRDAKRREYAPCCVSALETAIGHVMGRETPLREVNAALSHGGAALAFQDWWMDLRAVEEARLGEMLEELIDAGGDVAGARCLLAVHHDARGEAIDAELQLELAIADDPSYGPALDMLAGYASDRGDLKRAILLWSRAGADPDEGPLPFHRQLESRFDGVGRNDACPCGSGRKYKQCHLNRTVVDDDRRVSWMFDKVFRYRSAHHRHDAVAALVADALGEGVDGEDLVRLWGDEFVNDIAIFDDGIFEDFISDRAHLLPGAELDHFRLWLDEPLRCWEVTATDGVEWLTCRDAATGESVDVHDRSSASEMKVGDQLLTRLLPAFGARWMPPVALRVDLRLREQVLKLLDDYPSPEVWVRWYHGLFAPPTLTTTEGEPVVFSTATVRPSLGWDDLATVLDEVFERVEGDNWHQIHRTGDVPGDNVVRGTLNREGEVLEIQANAAERMDRILEMLDGHVDVVERSEQSLDEIEAATTEKPQEAHIPAEYRAKIIEEMEDRWLGESVPALGGMTPRQAADDPTRREDLLALLREFERMGTPEGAITFDLDSLRRKLGLE